MIVVPVNLPAMLKGFLSGLILLVFRDIALRPEL
jgi:hypothetical protein